MDKVAAETGKPPLWRATELYTGRFNCLGVLTIFIVRIMTAVGKDAIIEMSRTADLDLSKICQRSSDAVDEGYAHAGVDRSRVLIF